MIFPNIFPTISKKCIFQGVFCLLNIPIKNNITAFL
uniref:Uncharacterized protein n=1 Tax=Siphoviridae sp. ctOsn3 TaxID=2823577 RepID=A0A8S5LGL4_9CAUD|nr:MAG TPA: hypothetical protein [Siphoviridae sp. ctOsn3]